MSWLTEARCAVKDLPGVETVEFERLVVAKTGAEWIALHADRTVEVVGDSGDSAVEIIMGRLDRRMWWRLS